MKILLQIAFATFTLSLLTACGERQEEPLPELTYRQREIVDTLYMEYVTGMRPVLDSICEAQFEDRVARAVDSLLRVRRAEAERLRSRVLQEQATQ